MIEDYQLCINCGEPCEYDTAWISEFFDEFIFCSSACVEQYEEKHVSRERFLKHHAREEEQNDRINWAKDFLKKHRDDKDY